MYFYGFALNVRYDADAKQWKTDGCRAGSVASSSTGGTVECICNHMTDFALIKMRSQGECIIGEFSTMWVIFAGAFSMVGYIEGSHIPSTTKGSFP